MKRLFWNASERRVRALWRLVLQPLVLVLLALPLVAVFPGLLRDDSRALTTQTSVEGPLMMLAIWIAARLLDRRSFTQFGFEASRWCWADFAFGLTLGWAAVSLVFVSESAAGWIRVEEWWSTSTRQPFIVSGAVYVMLFVVIGVSEEVFSRGYQLQNMAEGLSGRWMSPGTAVWLAWVLQAALFAMLHLLNPGATVLAALNLCLAGLALGLARIVTGSQAMPIGLHISWNATMGLLFGYPVSGVELGVAVIDSTSTGPGVWTGGPFGPEGGLMGTMANAVLAVAVAVWVLWRKGALRWELDSWTAPAPATEGTGKPDQPIPPNPPALPFERD